PPSRLVRRLPAWRHHVLARLRVKAGIAQPLTIAPIRFLKQRPIDQRFARLGSPNFERLLCRVFHCGCDDEQRLLCFETGHSRREFFEASMAEGGRFLPYAIRSTQSEQAALRTKFLVPGTKYLGLRRRNEERRRRSRSPRRETDLSAGPKSRVRGSS